MSLTKKELVDQLAQRTGGTKAQAQAALDFVAETLQQQLKKGERIVLPGVGTFSLTRRKARTGRNPQTGETIKIKAANRVKFTAAKPMRDAAEACKKIKS